MQCFSLDRLAGPGTSIDENFELLCLDLVNLELPEHETFRIKPPDGGIDIYARSRSKSDEDIAIQCKAYERFIPALIPAVANSVSTAARCKSAFPWGIYNLVIPFVPTMQQATKLRGCFDPSIGEFNICDSDYLERLLFRHPHVARRFFPSIKIIAQDGKASLTLGIEGHGHMISLQLHIQRFGQTIPVKVSVNASVRSLLRLLIGAFDLPVCGSISTSLSEVDYSIDWQLWCEDGGEMRRLGNDNTFISEGLEDGSIVRLKFLVRFDSELGGFAVGKGGYVDSNPSMQLYRFSGDSQHRQFDREASNFPDFIESWVSGSLETLLHPSNPHFDNP